MAASRSRRANAGSRISQLVEQDLNKDEFYQTAYGGFEEVAVDEEYETEDSEDDVVDSDFDVSEKEEDHEMKEEEVETKPKRRKWMKSIAMKQKGPKPPREKKPRKVHTLIDATSATNVYEPRSLRKSTVNLSKETEMRRQEEERRRRKFGTRTPFRQQRRLTQEQLLEEAKQTEIENLASLAAYTRLEAERKTFKQKKRVLDGPIIRYHSVAMPLVSELSSGDTSGTAGETPSTEMYSRNFLTFTDTQHFPEAYFPSSVRKPRKLYCHVTGLPARYIDPLTGKPYTTAVAFRLIRNKYVKEKEEKCERRLIQLSSWLEEKKKMKQENNH